ncbi:hypothetical protein AALT52_01285 [Ligilactobacillus faecis]|uniref:Uncharacterized protein n=1 Tax=Ligilactobacillus faecis TaxID=762833 RepID=A0ABV4DP42_9LACO
MEKNINMISTSNILSKSHFLSKIIRKNTPILTSQKSIYDIMTGYDISQSMLNNISIEKVDNFAIRDDAIYLVKHNTPNHFTVSPFSIDKLRTNFNTIQIKNALTIVGNAICRYVEHISGSDIQNLVAKFREDSTGVFFDIEYGVLPQNAEKRLIYAIQNLHFGSTNAIIAKSDHTLIFKNLSIQISDKL